MAKLFKFEIITPERVFYSDEVEMVVFNTPNGEMGILADHAPMLIANAICTVRILKDGKEELASISEGFFEITLKGVTAVVDTAEWSHEIDVERAKRAKLRAEELLKSQKNDLEMEMMLKASIQRANARIRTAEGK